jgi:hypothetical protein
MAGAHAVTAEGSLDATQTTVCRLVQVVVSTVDFLQINHAVRIFVSTCNSGAPRRNPSGSLTYRGAKSSLPITEYPGPARDIKEVAVLGYALLPAFRIAQVS